MSEDLTLFENKRIRHIYDEEKKYIQRLHEDGSEQTLTNCHHVY